MKNARPDPCSSEDYTFKPKLNKKSENLLVIYYGDINVDIGKNWLQIIQRGFQETHYLQKKEYYKLINIWKCNNWERMHVYSLN